MALPPQEYAPILSSIGVTCVVRLNEPDTYDKREFERAGIRHYDLYFDDCTVPSDAVVARFLDICDREERVAVHCRAGLGRTGTLIALWMMKHAGFAADEAVGWLRIVRPGSVIGRQKQYLKDCEGRGWVGNLLGLATPGAPASARPLHRSSSSEELSAQVTAGMCARGAAKAAAGDGVPGRRRDSDIQIDTAAAVVAAFLPFPAPYFSFSSLATPREAGGASVAALQQFTRMIGTAAVIECEPRPPCPAWAHGLPHPRLHCVSASAWSPPQRHRFLW